MTSIFNTLVPPIHKEGWKFTAISAALTVFLTLLTGLIDDSLGMFFLCLGTALTIWCYYFFRDRPRIIPQGNETLVSPADGVVCSITKAIPPKELDLSDEPLNRIAIFMNVFNCHVNRTPLAGVVEKIAYHKGKFLNASFDKASDENERNGLIIRLENGLKLGVVQIAGLVARRILCEVKEDKILEKGERIGIIRFGSRVDVYLPDGFVPMVAIGQTTIAGETIIAHISANATTPDFKTL
jgi:phosphatidylserine decarboxylase